ncbi:hypothetical protein C0J52_10198 [Blattella germanica]|nr:hypothetical protein C0J52_10198 [Blattella germanica]
MIGICRVTMVIWVTFTEWFNDDFFNFFNYCGWVSEVPRISWISVFPWCRNRFNDNFFNFFDDGGRMCGESWIAITRWVTVLAKWVRFHNDFFKLFNNGWDIFISWVTVLPGC